MALTPDGLILAVGGMNDTGDIGATWIFMRSTVSNGFTEQGSKLVGSTGIVGTPLQGTSISLSHDGLTLAVGGPNNNSGEGATWIFTRTSTSEVFAEQGILIGSNSTNSSQGFSVSLSGDGLVLAVGGFTVNTLNGAVWIYSRSVITDPFVQQGSELTANDDVGSSYQGTSVSLSSDGLVLAYGGIGDNSFVGATWIFSRDSTADFFVQQGNKLIANDSSGASRQGFSVSLSKDGLSLAVGGPEDTPTVGATWIYRRKATSDLFVQQGDKLTGDDLDGIPSGQGSTVSLSANGTILATGIPDDNSLIGGNIVWKPICP